MKPDWNGQDIACVQPTLSTPEGKDEARSVITEGESKVGDLGACSLENIEI